MMSKEEWIEMYHRCENTIRYHLEHGEMELAQKAHRLQVEILHKIDDMGGLE